MSHRSRRWHVGLSEKKGRRRHWTEEEEEVEDKHAEEEEVNKGRRRRWTRGRRGGEWRAKEGSVPLLGLQEI